MKNEIIYYVVQHFIKKNGYLCSVLRKKIV